MASQDRVGMGVFVCIFNRNLSKIMLLKRNKEKRKMWGADWGNVGGKIEFGETSLQACVREAREEIGVRLKPSNLVLLEVKEDPHFRPHVHAIHFVYATTIDEKTKIRTNSESDDHRWFSMKNLPDKLLDPKKRIIGWRNLVKNKY